MKKLGILIQDNLPIKHVNKIFRESYKLLTTIKIAFHHKAQMVMKNTRGNTDQHKVGIGCSKVITSKKKEKKTEITEVVQNTMLSSLNNLLYEERQEKLALPILEERMERDDMIAVFRAKMGTGLRGFICL